MKLFNDLKTGSLKLYTLQITKILEDKIDDMDCKIDDMNNDFENRFQELEDEIKDIKDVFREITASVVVDLDRKIGISIKDIERRFYENIHQNTLRSQRNEERSQRNEERIQTLECHVKEPDLKDISLQECLKITSKNIGDDWRKLSDLLQLPTEGTSQQQQPHLNMKKCFENKRNLISWKTLKMGLVNLDRHDLVKKLQDQTVLTHGISSSIKRHRQKILETYEKANVFDPFKKTTTAAPPAQKQREDVFVDLAIVQKQTYTKEYSECENFIKAMTGKKQSISMDQLIETKDKFVLITGNAGIGKSELIDNLTLKWAKEELINDMPNIELFFPIRCRELTTMDLLPTDTFQSILERLFPEVFQEVTIDDFQELSHKVMFVVDGLDEMMHIERLNHPVNIKDLRVQKMVHFVRDVIVSDHKVFPNQYTVAVGRPYISLFIEESFDILLPIKCVYVCGFSKNSVDQYIQRNCDDIVQVKVTREIELSQNLAAMSHVPVYLWVICNIYKDDIVIETPRTTTELMMYTCLVFVRRHLIDYEKGVKNLTLNKLCDRKDIMKLIKSISWMSFDSLLHKRVLFENQHLGDIIHDVEELEKKTGFIVKSANGELGDLYQFSHLVLHELFCGLHMFFSAGVQFKVPKEKSTLELKLNVNGTNVEGDFKNCYAVVASVGGTICDQGKRNSVLFHFLKCLGDAYGMKFLKGKKLMQKFHQITVNICKSPSLLSSPYNNMTYFRCCFESNCVIPTDVTKHLKFEIHYLIIGSVLELRWLYHYFTKMESINIVIARIDIYFPSENLHKNDIKSLAYLLKLSKIHGYINGCIQVYEELLTKLKNDNSLLEEILIEPIENFTGDGLLLVLPYLKCLAKHRFGNGIILEKLVKMITSINEHPEKYKLQRLETYLDNDKPFIIEAVCNTMQHLERLRIFPRDEHVDSTLSYVHKKIKTLSESGRLKVKELEIHTTKIDVMISFDVIDCIRYIPKVVVEYHGIMPLEEWKECKKIRIKTWKSVINSWIESSRISIKKCIGKLEIRIRCQG